MRRSPVTFILSFFSMLAIAPAASGHVTYNLSGYGSGIDGSIDGFDGRLDQPPVKWTSGEAEGYVGTLPVSWYCGLHSPTQTRVIQTGLATSPPSNSLRNRVNASSFPGLPTDAVLAVGGLSWHDPSTGQGWGHGLDYGLIHVSELTQESVLAQGPVKLNITLADDPTDDRLVRLAYALYAGWDTSATSARHGTFTTSPSPVDNPLGSSGLRLIGYAEASAPGGTIANSYDVDLADEGHYTIFIGAFPEQGEGPVAGQYTLTAGVSPVGAANEQLAECQEDLSETQQTLEAMTADADADTVPDQRDTCASTPAGQFVDQAGCSQAQFCAALPVTNKAERKACKRADWQNDEPSQKPKQADCRYVKSSSACEALP
jgi:hypothetical protein